MRLGICCIINELRKQNIYTGRTCIKRNYSIDKASELALKNSLDLIKLLQYCNNNNIHAFRVGSEFLPRITEQQYKFTDLKDHKDISNALADAGRYAYDNNIILSCHPGPFTILASRNPIVCQNSLLEVEYHSLLADLLLQKCPSDTQFNINFHIGLNYSTDLIPIFIKYYNQLSDNAKKRITLENDDSINGWSIKKLYPLYEILGIPLVWDMHHATFSKESDITLQDEFYIAKATWGNKIQEIHVSESADTNNNIPKHSNLIENKLPVFLDNENCYALFEAKFKELSIFNYREKYLVDKI